MLNAASGRRADQVARRADLVGAVVERAEAARRGPVIVRPRPDSIGTSCSVISAPWPGGLGPMSWPTPSWRRPSAINVTPSTRSCVDRAAAVADIAGDVARDHRALREADQHIAGQRAAVVHVGHRLDRGAGALGAAVVVGHLLVGRERIVELRGVRNGEHLEPVGAELLPRSGWSR